MTHETSGQSASGRPVWASIPEAFRTHGCSSAEIDRLNRNRSVLQALTGHRDLRVSDTYPAGGAVCFWCGWRFDKFATPDAFACVSERDEDPDGEWVQLDRHHIDMRERRLLRSILDRIPDVWIPRSTPPRKATDLDAGEVTEAEAAFLALHGGIPADNLTPEAAGATRERIARDIATGNVLRYLMWLIGTEVHPASAAAEQATVNLLFRIRDEFGLFNPTEAGLVLDPNAASPVDVVDGAHARGAVLRFSLGDLDLYPGYQFKDEQPYGVIARLRETAARYEVSENSLVLWMVRATTLLTGPEGDRPVDLLVSRPDAIPMVAENSFGARW